LARIPCTSKAKAKRVEVRFPDPLANPYLGFAAVLMAGLDGVKNKLDPGPAMDKDRLLAHVLVARPLSTFAGHA
jgi:glutamine synthetase